MPQPIPTSTTKENASQKAAIWAARSFRLNQKPSRHSTATQMPRGAKAAGDTSCQLREPVEFRTASLSGARIQLPRNTENCRSLSNALSPAPENSPSTIREVAIPKMMSRRQKASSARINSRPRFSISPYQSRKSLRGLRQLITGSRIRLVSRVPPAPIRVSRSRRSRQQNWNAKQSR